MNDFKFRFALGLSFEYLNIIAADINQFNRKFNANDFAKSFFCRQDDGLPFSASKIDKATVSHIQLDQGKHGRKDVSIRTLIVTTVYFIWRINLEFVEHFCVDRFDPVFEIEEQIGNHISKRGNKPRSSYVPKYHHQVPKIQYLKQLHSSYSFSCKNPTERTESTARRTCW